MHTYWSIFNQKGGVGKTSVTCNLASAFASLGRKVCVVDLDLQANASQYLLGPDQAASVSTISDFFQSLLTIKLFKEHLDKVVYATPFERLYVIPADDTLGELQPKLEQRYKIQKLKLAIQALAEERGFDDVFFDTPPALNFYSMSALIASNKVLIPFDCDAFSSRATDQVVDIITEVRHDHQPDLEIAGIVINQFQAGASIPKQSVQQLKSQGLHVLEPYISSSVVMRESHFASKPMPYFKPRHKLAQEYVQLAKTLIQQVGEDTLPPAARSKLQPPPIQPQLS